MLDSVGSAYKQFGWWDVQISKRNEMSFENRQINQSKESWLEYWIIVEPKAQAGLSLVTSKDGSGHEHELVRRQLGEPQVVKSHQRKKVQMKKIFLSISPT